MLPSTIPRKKLMIKYQIFTRALKIAKRRLERNKGQECADLDWENFSFLLRYKKEKQFFVLCKLNLLLCFPQMSNIASLAEIVLTLFWCKISFYDCVAFIPGQTWSKPASKNSFYCLANNQSEAGILVFKPIRGEHFTMP